jgi:hypothetical protein
MCQTDSVREKILLLRSDPALYKNKFCANYLHQEIYAKNCPGNLIENWK